MFSICPFVLPLPNLWTWLFFENEWIDFAANWHMWSGDKGVKLSTLGIRRSHEASGLAEASSSTPWLSGFSSFMLCCYLGVKLSTLGMWHDHDIDFVDSGDCTLQCGMWLWNRDSEFTKWQYPAMWYVALGWHAIEFAKMSVILEFYIWFPFPHITAVDISFCTSLRNFIQIGPPSAEKNDVMSIFKKADLSHRGL